MFNKELRDKSKSNHLKFLWASLYILIVAAVLFLGGNLYHEYNERRLPSGRIGLFLNKTEYQLGETIDFTVVNHFPAMIYVRNNCPEEPLNVYRWNGASWAQLHDIAREGGKCYTQPRDIAIPPEGSVSYDFSDWPHLFLEPGIYRVAMVVEHYDETPFQDFVVLGPSGESGVYEEGPIETPVYAPTQTELEESNFEGQDSLEEEFLEHEYGEDD